LTLVLSLILNRYWVMIAGQLWFSATETLNDMAQTPSRGNRQRSIRIIRLVDALIFYLSDFTF